MKNQLRFAALSDSGQIRSQNDDRVRTFADRQIFVVSDGIGSHLSGGSVAKTIVEVLPDRLHAVLGDRDQLLDERTIERATEVTAKLSHEIRDSLYGTPGMHGSGATLMLAAIRGDLALFIHLGDSRAYRLRGFKLEQVTVDHTIGQILHKGTSSGAKDKVDVAGLGRLTRYVGMSGNLLIEPKTISLEIGDQLLLCTDGLSSVVPNETIRKTLGRRTDPLEACQELVQCANAAGSPDNVTVVVISVQVSEASICETTAESVY